MAVIDRATLDLINLIRSQQGANARQSNQMRGNEIIGQGILRGTENAVAGLERGRDRRQHQADRASDAQFRQQELDERRRRTDLEYGQNQADQSIFMQLARLKAGDPLNLTSAPRGDESDFFAPERQPGDIEVTGRESPGAMWHVANEADNRAKENIKLRRAETQRKTLLANAKSPEDIGIVNAAGPDELDNLLTASFAHNYKSQHDTQQAEAGAKILHEMIDSGAWGKGDVQHILKARVDAALTSPETFDTRALSNSFDSVVRPRTGMPYTPEQKAARAAEVQQAWAGVVPDKYLPGLTDLAVNKQSMTSVITKALSENGRSSADNASLLRLKLTAARMKRDNAMYGGGDVEAASKEADDLADAVLQMESIGQKTPAKPKKTEGTSESMPTQDEVNAAFSAAKKALPGGTREQIRAKAKEILKGA